MDAIRAWKDPEYRATLTAEQLATLPGNPAGETWSALSDQDLRLLVGGAAGSTESSPVSRPDSCGYICTLTTECPIFSFCCPSTQ